MTQIVTHDSRSAIQRARLFLSKAKTCSAEERIDFEAYLEASIIFARAAIHRVKTQYEKENGFNKWWDSLLKDSSVEFFRNERDFILKEGPPHVGQIIKMPPPLSLLSVGGQQVEDEEQGSINDDTISADETLSVAELYYYDDPSEPATDTVEKHLNVIEQHISNFISAHK